MISTAVYYMFTASALLLYGIGINIVAVVSGSARGIYAALAKILVSVFISIVLTQFITRFILSPFDLTALYPLISLVILFYVSFFAEFTIRITRESIAFEFAVSYLIVILASNECTSFFDAVTIGISCAAAFAFVLPLLYAVKHRLNESSKAVMRAKLKNLILISIAVIITAIAAADVSWLNVLH